MTPQNQKFMQLTMSPLEHVMMDISYGNESYWQQLPVYVISRCPLCGASYTSPLDVHSLRGWGTLSSSTSPRIPYFFIDKYELSCEHRLAVQKFVNLEGLIPSELRSYTAKLNVPFVMPFLVPDDLNSPVAVIHSFTICRLEDESGQVYDYIEDVFREPLKTREEMMTKAFKFREAKPREQMSAAVKRALAKAIFVPRYTAYAVTYYAEVADQQILIDRRMKPQEELAREDDRYWPVWLASMGEMSPPDLRAYDLPYWVKHGKLQWLDFESPDLPLKSEPVEDFPYVNIQFDWGNRYGMKF